MTGAIAQRTTLQVRVLTLILQAYRIFVSPLLGSACRFEPTCSRFAEEAVRRHGAVRGLWMSLRRISRCHPYHRGGLDPVP